MKKNNKPDVSKVVKAVSDIISPYLSGEADTLTWEQMRQEKKQEKEYDCMVGIMDSANVSMLYPKNEATYNLLKSLFRDNKDGWSRVPEIDYKTAMVAKSKFSTDYLEKFLNVAKALKAYSTVCVMGHDAPMTLEFQDDDEEYSFGFILAPRVGEE